MNHITSKDNIRLFFREHVADPDGIFVILVHGFAEHSGRYQHVIDALLKAHFNVAAFDLRGHGRSEGMRGFIKSFADYLADLHAVVSFVKKKHKCSKVFLMAHSMGGLVALNYASQHQEDLYGLILSSPLCKIKIEIPKIKKIVGDVMSKVFPAFCLPSTIMPTDLTHDKKCIRVYNKDKLIVRHVTARWFTEINKTCDQALFLAPRLTLSLLLQLSNDDKIVDYEQTLKWYENCHAPDKTKLVYDGFFHEIYNEVEKNLPIHDAIVWLQHQSQNYQRDAA